VTAPAKLLFDENFGKPMIVAVTPFLEKYQPKPVIAHLLDYFAAGVTDAMWIPKVATEGWIVVSGDRGKKSGGAKLPEVCAAHAVTHVLLSGTLQNDRQFRKVQSIIAVWDELMQLTSCVKGSRYLLRLTPSRKPVLMKRH